MAGQENLTVMVVDGSARAHAVSDAYERSPNVKHIIVAPGNDFIGYDRQKEVTLAPEASTKNPASILAVAQKYKPDLIDVCQDDALALGAVDLLQQNGFAAFGPTAKAARIEADKAWARQFQKKHGIPGPAYAIFENPEAAHAYAKSSFDEKPRQMLYFKAAGLCGGKGALKVCNLEDATMAIHAIGKLGDAGKKIVIEEGITGEEASIYSFSDGITFKTVRSAQDNKRQLNYDEGPNTGGMGAVAPAGVITANSLGTHIDNFIVRPAIKGLRAEGTPYVGVLYSSVMVMDDFQHSSSALSWVKVVEYNSRWGAPVAEVVVPGIVTPMDVIVDKCLQGRLSELDIEEDDLHRVCVVGATRGYPGDVSAFKGKEIRGLDEAAESAKIYSGGIAVRDGRFYANGGRLFSAVGQGINVHLARQDALAALSCIHVDGNGLQYRTDIGWRDVERFFKEGDA